MAGKRSASAEDAEASLTLRQAKFVAAYVGEANGNATRAADLAGYKTPHPSGSLLLRNATVAAAIARAKAAIMARGLAVREMRMRRYSERWEQLGRIVAERAADPRMAQYPGGTTGLLALEPQLVKVYASDASDASEADDGETLYSAKRDRVVYVAKLDAALLKEERELAKQAAQDAGQWQEESAAPPSPSLRVEVNVHAVHAAERAFAESLGIEYVDVGLSARPSAASDPGADPVSALQLPAGVLLRPGAGAADSQIAADGHEPGVRGGGVA